jgi:tight adherence protein C
VVRVNPAVAGALAAGLVLGLGLWSLASLAPRMRQPRLARRVAPYLQDVSAGARESLEPPSPGPIPVLEALVEPVISPLHRLLAAVSGSDDDLVARLRQAGRPNTLATHRTQQLLWAIAGAALGVLVGAVVSPTAGLVLTPVLAVAGVLLRDRVLVVQARRRLTRLTDELPVVLELMALSLSAGESATDAVRRIARVGSGELSREFAGAVASVATGVPFATALDELARELGLPPLRRCVDQVLGALDRGTPLAEVLLAQAQDARDEARRGFIEAAGRREIAMLVPLVFLILPVTVCFAILPGLLVLQTGFAP